MFVCCIILLLVGLTSWQFPNKNINKSQVPEITITIINQLFMLLF